MGRLARALIFLILLNPSAWAQDDTARAKEYYKEGERLLSEGRYKEAITAYQKGYELSQKPAFLYNMAVVHIEMEEYGPAYRLLVEYRTHAPASEWNNIDSMLDSIRPYVRNPWMKEQIPEETEISQPPTQAVEPTVQPISKTDDSDSSVLAYSVLGVSGITTIAGTILTVQARQAHKEAASLCLDQLCPSSAEPFLIRERNRALAADITFISGIVGLGAGVVLLSQPSRTAKWTVQGNTLWLHGQF